MNFKINTRSMIAIFLALAMSAPVVSAVDLNAAPELPASQAAFTLGPNEGWDSATIAEAVAANSGKVPVEFFDRFEFLLDDGRMRAIVNVAEGGDIADQLVGPISWMDEDAIALITPATFLDLLANPAVKFIEPDYPVVWNLAVSVPDVNGRGPDAAWDIDYNSFPGTLEAGAWSEAYTGEGVTVAVVDSGIDGTHRDFGGFDCTDWAPYQPCDSRITGHIKISGQLVDLGVYPEMDVPVEYTNELASGHGTHVAGTIAGNGYRARESADPGRYGNDGIPMGVAPEASLFDISNGDTLWAGLGSGALWWLSNNHADYGIKVSSNSWGCLGGCEYSASSATSEYIRNLFNDGVVVVFATGNDGSGAGSGDSLSANAESPYAIGVANYDAANHQLASSSSRGKANSALPDPATWTPESEGTNPHDRPDIAAPGTNIWAARTLTGGAASLVPRADVGDALGGGASGFVPYATMSGTSMATPHVSGAAAVLFDACPSATALDIFRALFAGANPNYIANTGGGAFTASNSAASQGYGALDVAASIHWLQANVVNCGGGVIPLSVSVDDQQVAVGNSVTLSATVTGGDGSAPAWDWSVTGPAGSTATLSDSTAANPSFTADVEGNYAFSVDVSVGIESANAAGAVTASGPTDASAVYSFVGDGAWTIVTNPETQRTTFSMSTNGHGDTQSYYTTVGPWNEEADENLFLPTFTTTDAVTFVEGATATGHVFVDSAFLNEPGVTSCPVSGALFDGAGTLLATMDVDPTILGSGIGFAGYEELVFEFTGLEAATHTGLKFQYGPSYVDCGNPHDFTWGTDEFHGRLEIFNPDTNDAPIANAGGDQTVDEGTTVALDGSGSSDDVGIVTYAWTQTSGPAVTLTGADTATASFDAPQVDGDVAYTFQLTVTDDEGATGTDGTTVTVQDTTVYAAEVTITDPAEGTELGEGQSSLTVSGDFDPRVAQDISSANLDPLALAASWENPNTGGNGDYIFIDAPADGSSVSGLTTLEGRAGNSPTDPNDNTCTENCCEIDCGEPYNFGEPTREHIRPGDLSSVCTLNFIYEFQDPVTSDYRYFFGTAAHCVGGGGSTDTNGCIAPPDAIGSRETLQTTTGQSIQVTLAYTSWGTMQKIGETDSGTCGGNDFALFEIDSNDLDKVHPATRMYGGPTGLGEVDIASNYNDGDELRAYGRSFLHDDTIIMDPESSVLNPKNGVHLGCSNDCWSHFVYLAVPGIPGDSGGGLMDIEGNAIGAASTVGLFPFPASNNYANIPRALEYMAATEGWAPTLVTWDDFDPNPRVSLVTGSSSTNEGIFEGILNSISTFFGGEPSVDVAAEAGDDGIVPGTLGEVGDITVSDDGSDLTISMVLGSMDDLVPTTLGNPVSYEASFATIHNGEITYRVDYRNEAVATSGVVPTGETMKQSFEMQVISAANGGLRSYCAIDADLSNSFTVYDEEAGEYSVNWVIPFDALVADTEPGQGACAQLTTAGRALQAGDTITDISGKAVAKGGTITFGDFQDETDEPASHTVGGCTSDCGTNDVTFTVNGEDAGGFQLAGEDWTFDIDFDLFTADANGLFTVVASHGTATETVTYSGPGADPCANLASKIAVTFDGQTACTEYDSTTAGTWSTAFAQLGDMAPGAYTVTATAHDLVGSPIASDTVTVHVAATNEAPTAVASSSADTVTEGGSVDLDGTASSDPEGATLTYAWSDDCAGTFADATLATTSWTAPAVDGETVCVLTLTVNDGELDGTDTLTVTVTDQATGESGGNMGNGDGNGPDCSKFDDKENGNAPAMCRDE